MAAHKWAEAICAWAKGEAIQYNSRGMWEDFDSKYHPDWNSQRIEWRIKPAEQERVYPVTQMSRDEIRAAGLEALRGVSPYLDHASASHRGVANAAIRHAIDAGQVVIREEFDRMCGDRKARDLAVARAVACRVAEGIKASLLIGAEYSTFDLSAIIAEVK